MKLTYYTRNNCQLCDKGEVELALALDYFEDIIIEEVDIDRSDELQQKYMLEVPVLSHGETVIQSGRLDFVTIFEYLEQHISRKEY